MQHRCIVSFIIVICVLSNSSCRKLVSVNSPSTRISVDNVYNEDITAIGVLSGIYSQMSSTNYISSSTASIFTASLWLGLSADEYVLWSGASQKYLDYYKNDLAGNTSGGDIWLNTYPFIYKCNAAIEGLNNSNKLTLAVKLQLLGEAKFLRAYFYFYLVNLYGDVPLVLTTDYTVNSSLPRTSKSEIFLQIISDLKDAESQLPELYKDITLTNSSLERVRPNKWAAKALLSRVYLYNNDWINAETEATSIINNRVLYDTVSISKVFLKNSKETIWQLQPVTSGEITNSPDAVMFTLNKIPVGLNASHPVALSSLLVNAFDQGDRRALNGNWISAYSIGGLKYYFASKYKDVTVGTNLKPTEYIMILRMAEQYLIRAESRANLNKIDEALSDLNVIRIRAGLNKADFVSKDSLIASILKERRFELFSEMGHRWLDLKRTDNINKAMVIASSEKGGSWREFQKYFPIPESDMIKNPHLLQNQGY